MTQMSKKTKRKPVRSFKKSFFDRLITRLEEVPLSFPGFVAAFASVVLLRSFIEGMFEKPHIIGILTNVRMSSWAFLVHFPLFYLSCFLVMLLVIRAVTRTSSIRIAKVLLVMFPVILLAPVIDWLFTGGVKLAYMMKLKYVGTVLLEAFLPWKKVPVASPGIRIETFLIFLGVVSYIYSKTRSWFKALGGAVICYGLIILIGGLPAFIIWFGQEFLAKAGSQVEINRNFVFLQPNCLVDLFDKKLVATYIPLLTILGGVFLYLERRKYAGIFFGSLRGTRYFHYLILLVFGILLGHRLSGGDLYSFQQPFNYIGIAALFLSLFYGFHSATLLNDVADRACDDVSSPDRPLPSGRLSDQGAVMMALGFLFMSLLGALSINFACFLVVVTCWVNAYLYSMPPFKFKKFLPVSLGMLSFAAYLSMLCGFAAFARVEAPQHLPVRATVAILLYVFLSVNIKDLKDYAGDKAAGYQTFLTLLGPRNGKFVIGLLVWASYILVPFIFQQKVLVWVGFVVGAGNFFYIRSPRAKELPLFLCYYLMGTIFCLRFVFTLDPYPADVISKWKPLPPVKRVRKAAPPAHSKSRPGAPARSKSRPGALPGVPEHVLKKLNRPK